jgi:hypothetical protein
MGTGTTQITTMTVIQAMEMAVTDRDMHMATATTAMETDANERLVLHMLQARSICYGALVPPW